MLRKFLTIFFLILSVAVQGQDEFMIEKPLETFFELEAGYSGLVDRDVRSVFRGGAQLLVGVDLAFGPQNRYRFRPQAGVVFFINQQGEFFQERLRIIKTGGQFSYDAYFIGQTTFFPYVSLDYNFVNNYDWESDGVDFDGNHQNVRYSDSYLRGRGLSTELGLKIQYRNFYTKLGYQFFQPTLRVRDSIVEEELWLGYRTPGSHQFNLNSFNVTVGLIAF